MRLKQRLALDLGLGFCREVHLTGARTGVGKKRSGLEVRMPMRWEEAVRFQRRLTLWSPLWGLFSFISGLEGRHLFTQKS